MADLTQEIRPITTIRPCLSVKENGSRPFVPAQNDSSPKASPSASAKVPFGEQGGTFFVMSANTGFGPINVAWRITTKGDETSVEQVGAVLPSTTAQPTTWDVTLTSAPHTAITAVDAKETMPDWAWQNTKMNWRVSGDLRIYQLLFPYVHHNEALDVANVASKLHALCMTDKRREANAQALDYFDDMQTAGRFTECRRTLAQLRPELLAPSTIITVLTITYHAKQKLPEREAFYQEAFNVVARTEGKRHAKELLAQYH